MIQVVWEFVVKPGSLDAFVEEYGPGGRWVRLFSRHPGYRGTVLLRGATDPLRFLTIDRWDTIEQRSRMLSAAGVEYRALDEILGHLTLSEREIGVFAEMSSPEA